MGGVNGRLQKSLSEHKVEDGEISQEHISLKLSFAGMRSTLLIRSKFS